MTRARNRRTLGFMAETTGLTRFFADHLPAALENFLFDNVDVAEVVRHQFVPNAIIKDIRIATETLTREDGSPSKVSSIEIVLYRGEDRDPAAKGPPPLPRV